MTDELDHPPTLPESERSGGGAAPILFAVALLALAGFLTYRWLRPAAPTSPAAAGAAPTADAAPEAVQDAAPAASPHFPALPQLDASDETLRQVLARLSSDSTWTVWTGGEALVRRFVASVLAIAEGRLPKPLLELVAVRGAFRVREHGAKLFIDDSSFARHDGTLAALESIDLDGAAAFWRWVRPLAESAWIEIAPPEAELAATLRRGLDQILATPTPPAQIEVWEYERQFRFSDPALEALSPAQKLLLRLGPERGERLRAWLRSVRALV